MSMWAHSPYVVSDSKSRRGSVLCSTQQLAKRQRCTQIITIQGEGAMGSLFSPNLE